MSAPTDPSYLKSAGGVLTAPILAALVLPGNASSSAPIGFIGVAMAAAFPVLAVLALRRRVLSWLVWSHVCLALAPIICLLWLWSDVLPAMWY
jgi:hypothetical protein